MQQQGDRDYIVYVVIIVCSLAAAIWLLKQYSPHLNAIMLAIARVELAPIALLSGEAASVRSALAAIDPSQLTTRQALDQLAYAGRWYACLAGPAVVYMGYKSWGFSVADRFRRTLTMRSLLDNNRASHPCIAPILNWPRSILDEPADSGPWMVARQPIQFVAEHGLLVCTENAGDLVKGSPVPRNMLLNEDNLANPYSPVLSENPPAKFNRDKCFDVFAAQFGPRFTGFSKMPRYLQKLFLAFLLFGSEKKKEAFALLDSLSGSFRLAPSGSKYMLDLSLGGISSSEINELLSSREVRRKTQAHNKYANLFILSLYDYARQKGVLPTAEFIWLRPVNRRLFYLCNNFGRRSAWAEIAGPWTYYLAEEELALSPDFAGATSVGDTEDDYREMVREGVNALEYAMYEEGWIPMRLLSDDAVQGRIISD